jgi:hypothetical protein
VRSYTYDQTNRLTQVSEGLLTTHFAYNGDGVRTSKTVGGDTTEYVLDLAASLPVVISDTEAVYLYGLDIIAPQHLKRNSALGRGVRETQSPPPQISPLGEAGGPHWLVVCASAHVRAEALITNRVF